MLRRIEAAAGRFNRWFASAAVAANTIQDARVVNATDVSALLRELNKPPDPSGASRHLPINGEEKPPSS